jgi:hypothetical protein
MPPEWGQMPLWFASLKDEICRLQLPRSLLQSLLLSTAFSSSFAAFRPKLVFRVKYIEIHLSAACPMYFQRNEPRTMVMNPISLACEATELVLRKKLNPCFVA